MPRSNKSGKADGRFYENTETIDGMKGLFRLSLVSRGYIVQVRYVMMFDLSFDYAYCCCDQEVAMSEDKTQC